MESPRPREEQPPYEIFERLGTGSSGVVYKARRRCDGALVVVKRIRLAALDRRAFEQVALEVELLKRLHHPHIVAHVDALVFGGSDLCLVMDYYGGGDLAGFMKRNSSAKPDSGGVVVRGRGEGPSIDEDGAMRWAVQLLLAVHYLHSHNIIHRDLKTHNIFVDELSGEIGVGDFGVARISPSRGSAATQTEGTSSGTPLYMAPEVLQGSHGTYKSDMWGIGCILYEIVAGRHPFESHDLSGLMVRVGNAAFQPLGALRCSAEYSNLVSQLLNLDPRQRPHADDVLAIPFVQNHLLKYLTSRRSRCTPNSQEEMMFRGQLTSLNIALPSPTVTPRGLSCDYSDMGDVVDTFDELHLDVDGDGEEDGTHITSSDLVLEESPLTPSDAMPKLFAIAKRAARTRSDTETPPRRPMGTPPPRRRLNQQRRRQSLLPTEAPEVAPPRFGRRAGAAAAEQQRGTLARDVEALEAEVENLKRLISVAHRRLAEAAVERPRRRRTSQPPPRGHSQDPPVVERSPQTDIVHVIPPLDEMPLLHGALETSALSAASAMSSEGESLSVPERAPTIHVRETPRPHEPAAAAVLRRRQEILDIIPIEVRDDTDGTPARAMDMMSRKRRMKEACVSALGEKQFAAVYSYYSSNPNPTQRSAQVVRHMVPDRALWVVLPVVEQLVALDRRQ